MSRMQARHLHLVQTGPAREPRRFRAPAGQQLTLDNVRGPWRASAAVGGAGVFCVVWTTRVGDFYAPLSDFAAPDVLRLVEACRHVDQEANGPGTSLRTWGRE